MNKEQREAAREVLGILQAQSQFRDVPVLWNIVRSGPRVHVTHGGKGVSVSVRLEGLSAEGLIETVSHALGLANQLYRARFHSEVTSRPSEIQSDGTGFVEHEGREYEPTEGDFFYAAREAILAWCEAVDEGRVM